MLAGIAMSVASMNDITAPSVSLEGKGIWLIQSLPVHARDVLRAKQKLHIFVTLPCAVILMLSLCLVLQLPVAQTVLLTLICILFVLLSSAGGLALNLLRPNLTWTNESVPIKQSMTVFICLFGGWILAAIIIVPYLILNRFLTPELYLTAVAVILALVVFLLNLWLDRKGASIFENL